MKQETDWDAALRGLNVDYGTLTTSLESESDGRATLSVCYDKISFAGAAEIAVGLYDSFGGGTEDDGSPADSKLFGACLLTALGEFTATVFKNSLKRRLDDRNGVNGDG